MKKNKIDFKKLNDSLNDLKIKCENMSDDELIKFRNHCLSDSNFRLILSKFPDIARKVGLFNGRIN